MKPSESFVLGIDAGATKTTVAVANQHKILGYGHSGSANNHSTPPIQIIQHIQTAVRKALQASHLPPTTTFAYSVAGMAGIDSMVDEQLAKRTIRRALHTTKFIVVNDVHIVLRSASKKSYGLALIAGTGAHGFGINSNGEKAHVGGLEYLISDEGSGYDMGNKALRAALRSADGRTKHTQLEELVLKHFKLKTIRDIEPLIYHQAYVPKANIGQLSLLVETAAKNNDWRAKEIVNETLQEVLLYIHTLVQRLHMKKDMFDIVLVGGVFKLQACNFQRQLHAGIKSIAPAATIIIPKQPPVVGAVHLAWEKISN